MDKIYDWLLAHPEKASAITAVASAAIAFIALIVAVITTYISYKTVKIQTRHNSLSVTPIPSVELNLRPDTADLFLYNHGLGPLLIEKLEVQSSEGRFEDFRQIFHDVDNDEIDRFVGLSLPGKIATAENPLLLVSFQLKSKTTKNSIETLRLRKFIIDRLQDVSISIVYTDLYGIRYAEYVKNFRGIRGFIQKS